MKLMRMGVTSQRMAIKTKVSQRDLHIHCQPWTKGQGYGKEKTLLNKGTGSTGHPLK